MEKMPINHFTAQLQRDNHASTIYNSRSYNYRTVAGTVA